MTNAISTRLMLLSAFILPSAFTAGCGGDDSGSNGNHSPNCPPNNTFDYALESATWDATSSTLETVGIFAPSEDASACSSLPMAEVVHRVVLPPSTLRGAVYRITPISEVEYRARLDAIVALTGYSTYSIAVSGFGDLPVGLYGIPVCHGDSATPFNMTPDHELAPDGIRLGLGGCDYTACGDGVCDPDEDETVCPGDCGCWNGIRESGEACDSGDLGGETCESQGFTGGTLACDWQTCTLSTSSCEP